MEIVTEKGKLDIPSDLELTIERTNPLMSDEGDSTLPVSLPSSSNNLQAIGHRHRIDRFEAYTNKIDASLRIGPLQKKGKLVMDSVNRRNGIDAVFAFDNSDLYVAAKSKSLKQIFSEYNGGSGYFVRFDSIANAAAELLHIYNGDNQDQDDYTIFPVAVSRYEEDGKMIYQYNNEIQFSQQPPGPIITNLVYIARFVHEGGRQVAVPEGYGLSPFLKLHRMIDRLFLCLGYTVKENVFAQFPFSKIVIVHNCSDCLVTPTLRYADMAPSCTLSEFLGWLKAKFHVQVSVNSENKTVRVIAMEDKVTANADDDLTQMAIGDCDIMLQPSKRIVLTPNTTIEGTEAAAETFDKLIEKHQQYAAVNEDWYLAALEVAVPGYTNALIMRRATGQFYTMKDGIIHALLGTNHFKYDRNNSEETEEYSQGDVIPLMLVEPFYYTPQGAWGPYSYATAPYIGERIHAHTKLTDNEDQEEEQRQEIIIAQAYTSSLFTYKTTGTTQGYIQHHDPKLGVSGTELELTLTAYGLYKVFWKKYNELLLNSSPHIKLQLKLNFKQLLNSDMTTPKLLDNQKLIPISASSQVSDKLKTTEAEFILSKSYMNEIRDTEILPSVII